MSDNAGVTVIVPIYNVAEYLDKCILSILRQTYKQLQIILVDDGSTDDSGQICDRYKESDSRIVVIHKQNEGLVKARKTGLLSAKGEYICYVDGDDWIEPDMVEHLAADMIRTGAQLVVSNYFNDTADSVQKVCGKFDEGIYDTKSIIPTMLYTGEFYEFGISQFVWAKLFRKSILQDVQMQVDERIRCGEDVAVTYPYILKTHEIYFTGYAGYHYMQRADSMTNQYDMDEYGRNKILLEYLRKAFRHTVYADSMREQLNQYAKNLLLVRQIGFFDSSDRNIVLEPYGGVPIDARLVIYGAGKLGQSIYHYLKEQKTARLVDWLDRNYLVYKSMNYDVNSPDTLETLDTHAYDYVIVAINNQNVAESVCRYLESMGVEREKLRCISRDFIKTENFILDQL